MSIDFVSLEAWRAYPWLVHGFSTRPGGVSTAYGGRSLNLGWTKEDAVAAVKANRRLLVEAAGVGSPALVTLRQTHGIGIHRVGSDETSWHSEDGRAVDEGDGLVTSTPGWLLGIQTADCVPVMLVDPRRRAVAVLHAGWRGTAAGMATAGVERMREEFGSRPEELLAAIGPSIGRCCYAVGAEVREAFAASFSDASALFEEDRLDLSAANRRKLLDAGVSAPQITTIGECTGCTTLAGDDRKYFSHRVEGGRTGRMMNVIGIVAT